MAFMMPVVKKNYALYASPGPGSSVGSGTGEPRQRRTSDQVDGRGNPKVTVIGPGGVPVPVGRRRKVKSEGQSLSTSPGGVLGGSSMSQEGGSHQQSRSRPVDVGSTSTRRGGQRGSAPILMPGTLHSFSLQHSSKMGGRLVIPSSSAPTSADSPILRQRSSQSGLSISSSSTSSSDSTTTGKKFHSKLVMRLRKTFRIKDTEPTST